MPFNRSPVGGRYPESGKTAISTATARPTSSTRFRFPKNLLICFPFVANIRFVVVSWVENRRRASISKRGGRGVALRMRRGRGDCPTLSRSCPDHAVPAARSALRQGRACAAHVGGDPRVSPRQAPQG